MKKRKRRNRLSHQPERWGGKKEVLIRGRDESLLSSLMKEKGQLPSAQEGEEKQQEDNRDMSRKKKKKKKNIACS